MSTLNLGILDKINVFAFMEELFITDSWKKTFVLFSRIKIVPFSSEMDSVYSDLIWAIYGYYCIFMRFLVFSIILVLLGNNG